MFHPTTAAGRSAPGLGRPSKIWQALVCGLDWIADGADAATLGMSAILLAALAMVMVVGVFYRYVLNSALPWTEELAGFAMGWQVFLGAAVLFRRGGHPAMTVLESRLSPRRRSILANIRDIAVGAYLVLLLLAGLALVGSPHQPHSPALHISYALPYLAIPVASVLMMLQWLRTQSQIGPRRLLTSVAIAGLLSAGLWSAFTSGLPDLLYELPGGLLWLVLPLLFLLGVPIAIVLGLFSITLLAFQGSVPLSIAAQRIYAGVDNPAFLAIPAFMLTGALMHSTGMSEGLVNFASVMVGRVRGGLAVANVVASVLFADTSGSAVADTAAIGAVMMPGMRERGYAESFVVAHQAASGSLGTLFPPSISMIIFATVTSVSVTGLFLSSIVPGLLVAATYMLIAYVVARRAGYPREQSASAPQMARITLVALPSLVAPVIVLGGILLGVFTPYEAGGIAALYVFLAAILLRRRRRARNAAVALIEGVKTASIVLFIIANASILAWVMIDDQIPQQAAATVDSLTHEPKLILFMVSGLLILLAIVLEPPAILIAVIPILLLVVQAVGVNPLHFGVVVMLTTSIGMLLPPIGITLLVSASILGTPIEKAARAVVPYVLVTAADLVVVIMLPQITTVLPTLIRTIH